MCIKVFIMLIFLFTIFYSFHLFLWCYHLVCFLTQHSFVTQASCAILSIIFCFYVLQAQQYNQVFLYIHTNIILYSCSLNQLRKKEVYNYTVFYNYLHNYLCSSLCMSVCFRVYCNYSGVLAFSLESFLVFIVRQFC